MSAFLVATNVQKVLDFFIQNSEGEFTSVEVQKSAKLSKTGINLALRELAKEKFITRQKRAKIYLYAAINTSPIIKQLKVLKTIVRIYPLLEKIKNLSKKIVLFGSCSRGENTSKSDIDLFVMTKNTSEVRNLIENYRISQKIQCLIKTPLEFSELQKNENVFYEEITRGITLWEAE